MAIRMPSQRKVLYHDIATGGVSNDAWTSPASGGTGAGHANLVKDLSILNRYGLEHTTRDGTPLVYRVRVTLHGMTFAGAGPALDGFRGVQTYTQGYSYVASDESDDVDSLPRNSADGFTTIKIDGCQNNWVMKNAAEAFHAAREKMFDDAGLPSVIRGKYSHTIRYNYNGASDTWLTPVDGNGAALNGGTWDVSTLAYEGDTSFQLGLVGSGDDEYSDEFAGTYMSIGHAHLLSRVNMPADTNPQMAETPARYSVLRRMLAPNSYITPSQSADISSRARDEQDNPPYEVLDISASGDVDHDITEPVELGRMAVELGAISKSMIIDVPFGIMDVRLQHYNNDDVNEVFDPVWGVELLNISEMQG